MKSQILLLIPTMILAFPFFATTQDNSALTFYNEANRKNYRSDSIILEYTIAATYSRENKHLLSLVQSLSKTMQQNKAYLKTGLENPVTATYAAALLDYVEAKEKSLDFSDWLLDLKTDKPASPRTTLENLKWSNKTNASLDSLKQALEPIRQRFRRENNFVALPLDSTKNMVIEKINRAVIWNRKASIIRLELYILVDDFLYNIGKEGDIDLAIQAVKKMEEIIPDLSNRAGALVPYDPASQKVKQQLIRCIALTKAFTQIDFKKAIAMSRRIRQEDYENEDMIKYNQVIDNINEKLVPAYDEVVLLSNGFLKANIPAKMPD